MFCGFLTQFQWSTSCPASHKAFLNLSQPALVISFPTTRPLVYAPARPALFTSGLIPFSPLAIFTGCASCLEHCACRPIDLHYVASHHSRLFSDVTTSEEHSRDPCHQQIHSEPSFFFQDFIFKQSLHPTWGSNSQPRDQESHALPTKPVRCPSKWAFLPHFIHKAQFLCFHRPCDSLRLFCLLVYCVYC